MPEGGAQKTGHYQASSAQRHREWQSELCNYLSSLYDLVLLMDESRHYRADRGMEVINYLNPILGLELTATPQVERSGGAIKFRNVVYEYWRCKV